MEILQYSMIAKVYSVVVSGLDGHLVEVEVDIHNGMPAFIIVGLPDTAIQESRERVRDLLSKILICHFLVQKSLSISHQLISEKLVQVLTSQLLLAYFAEEMLNWSENSRWNTRCRGASPLMEQSVPCCSMRFCRRWFSHEKNDTNAW
jgi:hypothetical protein